MEARASRMPGKGASREPRPQPRCGSWQPRSPPHDPRAPQTLPGGGDHSPGCDGEPRLGARHLGRHFLAPHQGRPKSGTTQPCSAQGHSSVTTPRVAPAPAPGGRRRSSVTQSCPAWRGPVPRRSHTPTPTALHSSRPGDWPRRQGHPETHLCVQAGHPQAGGKWPEWPKSGLKSQAWDRQEARPSLPSVLNTPHLQMQTLRPERGRVALGSRSEAKGSPILA